MTAVAILGCGPAGLLAAHAAHESGAEVTIYSMKKPSPIGGAQFLHRSIPGLTSENPDGLVNFLHVGDPAVYAEKVYGDPKAETSWGSYADGHHEIWNMHQAYQKLWRRYEHLIIDWEVSPDFLKKLMASFDVVMSAIPLRSLCVATDTHKFESQRVYISSKASFPGTVENLIIYNGSPKTDWYRSSRIFGHGGTEWSGSPGGSDLTKIHKPLRTDCTCWPTVHRLGRYGAWKKNLLIHHAFEAALAAMEGQGALFEMQ